MNIRYIYLLTSAKVDVTWDATFKNILKQLLSRYGVDILSELDVPRADLRLDFQILGSQLAEFFNRFRPVIRGSSRVSMINCYRVTT